MGREGRPRTRVLARLVGSRDQDLHRDDLARGRPRSEPTLFEIWVCADGYWCDHTKNLVVGELASLPRARGGAAGSLRRRGRVLRPGASLAELDRRIRAGIEALGFPVAVAPGLSGVGARAHEPPYAQSRWCREIAEGMVLTIEPGCYIEGGGGLRVEDNFLITAGGAEALALPRWDGCSMTIDRSKVWTGDADAHALEPQPPRDGRPLRHDPARW